MKRVQEYNSIIFDCDGVILNSNSIKSTAFFEAAKPYGEKPARELLNYHQRNGGISRYIKFKYFLEKIVPKYYLKNDISLPDYSCLLERYGRFTYDGLLSCEISYGLPELKCHTKLVPWFVVSGGSQCELRDVFQKRKINHYFDGGIYGSPSTKDEIFSTLLNTAKINHPSLYLGDSQYDYFAAKKVGLDFVFVSQWSEVQDWRKFTDTNQIESIASIKSLIKLEMN